MMCETYTGTIIAHSEFCTGLLVQFSKNGELKEGFVSGQTNMKLSKKSYLKNEQNKLIVQDHLQIGKQVRVSVLLEKNNRYHDLTFV